MIGDLILTIRLHLKQCFCVHNYKRFHCGPDYIFVQCTKCGKITKNYKLINEPT